MDQISNLFYLSVERYQGIFLEAFSGNILLIFDCRQKLCTYYLVGSNLFDILTHSIHWDAWKGNIATRLCSLGNILKLKINVAKRYIDNYDELWKNIRHHSFKNFLPFASQYFFPDMKSLFSFLPSFDLLSQHIFCFASNVKNRQGLVVWHKSWHSSAVSDLTYPFRTFLSFANSMFNS